MSLHPDLWQWPQWLILTVWLIRLGAQLALHGETVKPRMHSAWDAAWQMALTGAVLWFGGFFP